MTDESAVLGFGDALAGSFTGEQIASSFSTELQREVCPEHPLHGVKTEAVAFCKEDPNEVLFVTNVSHAPIACVHLTWEVEAGPDWPHFDAYQNLEEWTLQMRREHEGSTKGAV